MKTLMVTTVAAATVVLLTACAPGGELSARRAAELDGFARQCVAQGHARGTSAFDACVRHLDEEAVLERFRRGQQIRP